LNAQTVSSGLERQVTLAVVTASIFVFGALLVLVPPFFLTFDEAKYIGIGYNVLDGLGPLTPFGGYFLPHAPVWSTVLVLPDAWLGLDPLDTGHAFNGIAGMTLIGLTAWLGWRIRPAVGGIGAIGLLGVTYLHDLTRTARLDVPAAALALGYLAVGFIAVRRGGAWWGIAAGSLFALAFLVKEIALPLAPVPFLAAILLGTPWRQVAGIAGWTLITAMGALSWWFVLVADLSGVVYRLETPAWTLGPIAAALALIAVILIVAGRSEGSARFERAGERLHLGAHNAGRSVLVVVLTVAWCAALLGVFAGTLELRGTDVIDTAQLARYAAMWLPGALMLVAAVGAAGVILSVFAWRSASGESRSATAYLWLATICSAPLVILVIEVGEPPRNYFAQLGILAALSGAGWLWLGEAAIRWLSGRGKLSWRTSAGAVPVAMICLLLGAAAVLAQHALTFRETRSGSARAAAIQTAVDWVRSNVPPGETVAIGSFLSYEISLGLRGTNPTNQVRHQTAIGDSSAPDGIRVAGQPSTDDWIAIDVGPRNVNEFQAFAAETLARRLRESGATVWIYATEAAVTAPEIVDALVDAPGVVEVGSWSWPTPTIPIGLHVYRIDASRLAFSTDRIHISADALERLVAVLEAAGTDGRATAANLVDEIVLEPESATTDALLGRLRALAAE
jgi:hypothetical protein